MKVADCTIGLEFYTPEGRTWRCTDVGTRTVAAIELRKGQHESWLQGPPYLAEEVLFDEGALRSAYTSIASALVEDEDDSDNRHPGYPHEHVSAMMRERVQSLRQYQRVLRIDRIAGDDLLHPYCVKPSAQADAASIPTGGELVVLFYRVFAQTFGDLPLDVFIGFPAATPRDIARLADQFDKTRTSTL